MRQGVRMAPSRVDQKQVIAFLQTNQAEAAYAKAARDDKTNQEIIGEAINAVFSYYGLAAPVPSGHRRVVRRSRARAQVRNDGNGPSCRAGRVSYGGWFDKSVVEKLQALSSEFNISVQAIIEHGLQMVTGVAAVMPVDDADFVALPLDSSE